MVFSYDSELQGQFENLSFGITSAIELPQPKPGEGAATDFSYESPGADLGNMKDVTNDLLKKILFEHLGSGVQTIGTDSSFSSGIERMIANVDVMDKVEKNQSQYSKIEKRIFDILKRWELLLSRNSFKEESELTVVFKKPKVLISDSEILANIKMRMDMGLMTKVQALMVIDPNMSEEEARDLLEEIDEEKMNRAQSFGGMFNANESVESDEDSGSEPIGSSDQPEIES